MSGATRDTPFTRQAGVELPLIGGAMYPCSNPELVAAVSEAGAMGIVQPVSLTYVHGHEYREGLRLIRNLTAKPVGFNALIEASSAMYHQRMIRWVEIALEEGIRFFITSLGNPRWVCERVHRAGGFVYHDVTSARWARKGIDAGVDGLIAVNDRAGGHAGNRSPVELFDELAGFGVPLVSAGGVATPDQFVEQLRLGYAAVQVGTRFIASTECRASDAYKQAIVEATERDIVLTERLTGLPVAVINNAYIRRLGTRASPLARWLLRGHRTKRWMRTWYGLTSLRRLKADLGQSDGTAEYWQAGRSVAGIHDIRPVAEIVSGFRAAWQGQGAQPPP